MCEPGLLNHKHKHKHKHNVHVVSNGVIFPQILYDIIAYARQFLPVKFFLSIAFINSASVQLPENVTWTGNNARD